MGFSWVGKVLDRSKMVFAGVSDDLENLLMVMRYISGHGALHNGRMRFRRVRGQPLMYHNTTAGVYFCLDQWRDCRVSDSIEHVNIRETSENKASLTGE
jgi:hypothetical protein